MKGWIKKRLRIGGHGKKRDSKLKEMPAEKLLAAIGKYQQSVILDVNKIDKVLAQNKKSNKKFKNTDAKIDAEIEKLEKYQNNLLRLARELDNRNVKAPSKKVSSWAELMKQDPTYKRIGQISHTLKQQLSTPKMDSDAIELKELRKSESEDESLELPKLGSILRDSEDESIELPEIGSVFNVGALKQIQIEGGDNEINIDEIYKLLDEEHQIDNANLMISIDVKESKEELIENYNRAKEKFFKDYTALAAARTPDKAREIGRDTINSLDKLDEALVAFEDSPYDFSEYQVTENIEKLYTFAAHIEDILEKKGIDINDLVAGSEKNETEEEIENQSKKDYALLKQKFESAKKSASDEYEKSLLETDKNKISNAALKSMSHIPTAFDLLYAIKSHKLCDMSREEIAEHQNSLERLNNKITKMLNKTSTPFVELDRDFSKQNLEKAKTTTEPPAKEKEEEMRARASSIPEMKPVPPKVSPPIEPASIKQPNITIELPESESFRFSGDKPVSINVGDSSVYMYETIGKRPTQEDAMIAFQASDFDRLTSKDINSVFSNTAKFLQARHGKVNEVGSTMIGTIAWKDGDQIKAHTTSLGDSLSYLIVVNDKGEFVAGKSSQLNSYLHNLDKPSEEARIRQGIPKGANNAEKEKYIYDGRLHGLAVTGALGDKDIEKYGLTHTPHNDAASVNLNQDEHAFVIVACDGLTEEDKRNKIEGLTLEEIGTLVAKNHSNENLPKILVDAALADKTDIMHEGQFRNKRPSGDNISVGVMPVTSSHPVGMFVFDGHSGDQVANAAANNFHDVFFAHVNAVVIPPKPKINSLDLSPKKEAKAKDHDARLNEAKRLIKSIINFKQIIDLEHQLNPVSREFTRTRENLAGLLQAAEKVENIKQEQNFQDYELFENKDQEKYESRVATIKSLIRTSDKNLAELERRKQEAASMKVTTTVTHKQAAKSAKAQDSANLTPASRPEIKPVPPAVLPPAATPDVTPAEAAKVTPTVMHKQAAKPAEKGIPYYTTFYRHETSKTENEAVRHAKAYLAEHGVKEIRQAVSLNVGNRLGFKTQECEYRSLLTKVTSKKPFGKPEQIPVAIVQQIKPDKTFTKQDVLTGSGDIKNINRLPAGGKARMEKRMEQIQFAANLVETALAAIKETGPVRAENWPTNLMNAAAVYCEQMGYDFHPKSVAQNISAREKASYESAFKKLEDTAEFSDFLKIATDRQAIKQEHASAPRPGKS